MTSIDKGEFKENGAVIVLFALLVVTLFALVALTVDTTLITSSQSHLRTGADAAVLGALEEYGNELSKSPPSTPAAALTAANTKARQYLRQNFNYNPGKFLQKQTANYQDAIGSDCTPGVNANGCLRPIDWYPAIPASSCPNPLPTLVSDANWRPCPCNESCECGLGCAKDPMIAVPARAGNGLKLEYRTDQNSPLKALFGQVIEIIGGGGASPEVGLQTTSRAVLTPRNAVFAIDLSSSMTSLARASGSYAANYYDYKVPGPMGPTDAICMRQEYSYPFANGGTCDGMGLSNQGPLTPAPDSNCTDPRNNYYNCGDTNLYTCFSSSNSKPIPAYYPGVATPQLHHFLINTAVTPEPLTSALDAVNQAMNAFKTQKVPNDHLGIIGFDDERIDNRILATNKSDPANIEPSPLSDPEFDQFEQATRVIGDPPARNPIPITDQRRYSKFLFPRYFNSLGVGGIIGSDLPSAFRLAKDMIMHADNYRNAQNFVVMFSDGMSNCLSFTDPRVTTPPTINRCVSDELHLTDSLDLIRRELLEYSTNKIAAHFVLLGAKSQPHRLAWKNAAGKCALEDEILTMAPPVPALNAQGAFDPDGTPLVNQIYPWIKATGGLWAPILDSYGVNPAGGCPNIDPVAFDIACGTLDNAANRASVAAAVTSGGTTAGGVLRGGTSAPTWAAPSIYWDVNGRILCDPQNRTISQQVNEYMRIILSKPPFVLVKPT